jgi:hypothetical protein
MWSSSTLLVHMFMFCCTPPAAWPPLYGRHPTCWFVFCDGLYSVVGHFDTILLCSVGSNFVYCRLGPTTLWYPSLPIYCLPDISISFLLDFAIFSLPDPTNCFSRRGLHHFYLLSGNIQWILRKRLKTNTKTKTNRLHVP